MSTNVAFKLILWYNPINNKYRNEVHVMSFYTIEQWTIKDVAKAFISKNGDESNRKVVIPIFQRGLRWENSRRAAFIDSLNQGYPFGSLLFAKQNEPNTYSVVDGLQRGSTICDYVYNPLTKNNIDAVDPEVLSQIRDALFPGNLNESINLKIQEIILSYFDCKKSFDNVDLFELSRIIVKEIPTQEDLFECASKINDSIRPFFNNRKMEYDNICSSAVPIVVYSGPNNLLSEIFNRINVKGIPLNSYEIYAAVWSQDKRVVNCDAIIKKVVDKYLMLSKNGYTIEDFDATNLLINKQLTAFEYLFGLGKYWCEKFPCLKLTDRTTDDEVNEIGFEIVDACISETKDISNLDKNVFKFNINKLQRRIEEAIVFVSDSIATIGSFKGNQRKMKNLHSKYQIISLISYTFRAMYDSNNLDEKRKEWDSKCDMYKKNLLMHYVADIISNEWHDGGGSKVYTANREQKYSERISKQRLETLLDSYFQSQFSSGQSERFSAPTNADSVILNSIYVNIFTANDQLSTKKFDIEHLATKERMKKIMKIFKDLKLPVSCIANLCYLPEDINRGKKEKTIYEATSLSMPIADIESKFSFTVENDFNWIYKKYSEGEESIVKKSFEDFLTKRYLVIKEKFLNAFGY